MKIGYARVSTEDQNLDLQIDALKKAGCEVIYSDHGRSGADTDRSGLNKAIKRVKSGDILVVWRLDRLGRSLSHLIQIVHDFRERDIGLVSVNDSIDTTSPGGRFYMHILAALAEFERELISERTRAGMEAARRRGVHIGPRYKIHPDDYHKVYKLIDSGMPKPAIADRFKVTAPTINRIERVRRLAKS